MDNETKAKEIKTTLTAKTITIKAGNSLPGDIKEYIVRIKKDNVPLSLGFLDEDIREDARGKQIERYEQRIKELQKQFEEL